MNSRCLSAFAGLTMWVVATSCSSSDEESQGNVNQTDSGTEAGAPGSDAGQCPLVAISCPSGCAGIDGFIFDEEGQCLSRLVRLGCRAESGGGTTDMACVREVSTGWLYQLESGGDATALVAAAEYDACSDEERQTVLDAVECTLVPQADAGGCPNDRTSCPAGCLPFEGREYNRTAQCFEPATQLGCHPEGEFLSPNGSCAEEISTGKAYLVESGSYSDDLLFSGEFRACGLDDIGSAAGDCP